MSAPAGAQTPTIENTTAIDCYRLELAACHDSDLALLDVVERARAARFHFERDRTRYIAAHAQSRRHLGARLGVAPADVRLTTTPYGKPILAPAEAVVAAGTGPDLDRAADAGPDEAPHAFCFNLTHSGAVGYLAIACVNVGIDVELHRPIDDLQALIDTYCTRSEIEALAALPNEQRLCGFLGVWTRKEAVLKAWGTGIGAIPLDALHVGTTGETVDARQILLPDVDHGPVRSVRYPGLTVRSVAGDGEVLSVAAATSRPLEIRMMIPGA